MSKIHWVILASWKWMRMKPLTDEMWVPKHLLSLREETVTWRISRQISSFCSDVLVVVSEWEWKIFEDNLCNGEKIIKKKEGQPFTSDIKSVLDNISESSRVLITFWDLVFHDSIMDDISRKVRYWKNGIWIERNKINDYPIRYLFSEIQFLINFVEQKVDPESTRSFIKFLLKTYWVEFLKWNFWFHSAKVLANLNTPEDYEDVKRRL